MHASIDDGLPRALANVAQNPDEHVLRSPFFPHDNPPKLFQ